MNKQMRNALVVCGGLIAAACDGLSDVGNQDGDEAPPTAAVVILNQPFSKDAAGNVTARVRSGAEVVLSGKDSEGTAAPVLGFEWLARNDDAANLRRITRNSNTISFTAPAALQETTLQFRLRVTDANGAGDETDVDVTVAPIRDPDHFLTYDVSNAAAQEFKLIAATSRDVTSQEMPADVSFRITVRRLVDYTTPGVDGPYLEVGTEQYDGAWLAPYGAARACSESTLNPVFTLARPHVDLDDILAATDATQAALEPNPALVDSFKVKLQVSINVAGGSLPADAAPQVCAPEVTDPAAQAVRTDPASGLLELDLEQLAGAAASTGDTPTSARAYYDAIDPLATRTTLLAWLQETGFIAGDRDRFSWSDLEAGSAAHAIYTNNFDLGFGRDMYARIVRCDGPEPQIGQPIEVIRVGTCDVAAVVINYPSLEAATKKLNPQLAVAMEYSRTAGSGNRRIVQFYTFAPDSVTGRFERVLSANLDGRGEKYMPQVCTVCHGGTPGGLVSGAYANAGDVGASFLMWDLDSFLYSDADGAQSDRSYSDEAFRSRYTRAAQAESLRRLNQLAYLTFHDDARPTRFTLVRGLAEGWYGKAGAPDRAFVNTAFNGEHVPAGWTTNGVDGLPNTADDNPADATQIYHDVFARNCRACHIAHVPDPSVGGPHLENIADNGTSYNTCDATLATDEPQWTMQGNQLPMACYRHLINTPTLGARLSEGVMPFARLSMDRFWVSADGQSAAALLQAHAAGAGIPIGAPGVPNPCIDPFGQASGSAFAVTRHQPLRLSSQCSRFVDAPTWALSAPAGSAARWVGETTRSPALIPDRQGEYIIGLAAADGTSTAVTAIVPVAAPSAGSGTQEITLASDGSGVVSVDVTTLNGFSSLDPLAQILVVQQSGVTATPDSARDITIAAGSLAGGFLLYRLIDADGDASDDPADGSDDARLGRIDVLATTTLVAGDASIDVATNGVSSPINLRALIQPAFAASSVTFSIAQQPGLSRFRGAGSVTSPASGSTTYTAPRGVASQFQQVTLGPTDSFTYQACLISDPEECDTGTITVRLTASQPFTDINNLARGTCAPGCHENVQTGANLRMFPTEAEQSTKALYCALRTGLSATGGTGVEPANTPYVNLQSNDPAASLIHRKASGLDGHGGGGPLGTAAQRNALAAWIDEGAYFTEGANQQCP